MALTEPGRNDIAGEGQEKSNGMGSGHGGAGHKGTIHPPPRQLFLLAESNDECYSWSDCVKDWSNCVNGRMKFHLYSGHNSHD